MSKRLSKSQLANRANAQKSTGPRTPQGKLRSAANAIHHGFTGANFAVTSLEFADEIDQLKADLVATYQPINSQEMFTIERIALAQNSMLRCYRLEAGLAFTCINEANFVIPGEGTADIAPGMIHAAGTFSPEQRCDAAVAQCFNYDFGTGFARLAKKSEALKLFLRYKAQVQRDYDNAIEELNRLRAMRDELDAQEPTACEQPVRNEPNSVQSTEAKPVIVPIAPVPDTQPENQAPQPDR